MERPISLQRSAVTEPIANLVDIENMAVELVTLAGAEIVRTFGAIFSVRYKPDDAGVISLRDPVSEVWPFDTTVCRNCLAL